MKPPKQLKAAVLGAVSLALASAVSAQEYPVKPVRVLVGFAAGSATEQIRREVALNLKLARSAGINKE